MAVGGIPMYLSYVTPGQSLAQTIDQLFFARVSVSTMTYCKRLHDDVLHISKKPLRGELSGFLSIYQAEASCISPKVY